MTTDLGRLESLIRKAIERLAALTAERAALQAEVRDLKQQLEQLELARDLPDARLREEAWTAHRERMRSVLRETVAELRLD
jgi:hypothetical protein